MSEHNFEASTPSPNNEDSREAISQPFQILTPSLPTMSYPPVTGNLYIAAPVHQPTPTYTFPMGCRSPYCVSMAYNQPIPSMLPPPSYSYTPIYNNATPIFNGPPPAFNNTTHIDIRAGCSIYNDGRDLPLHDVPTLRFFYNMGVFTLNSILYPTQNVDDIVGLLRTTIAKFHNEPTSEYIAQDLSNVLNASVNLATPNHMRDPTPPGTRDMVDENRFSGRRRYDKKSNQYSRSYN